MKLSEIFSNALDVIADNPIMIVPCLVPFLLKTVVNASGLYWVTKGGYWQLFFGIQRGGMSQEEVMAMLEEVFPDLAAISAVSALVNIIIWVTAVIAFSMVISMTAASLEGKTMTLPEAFKSISDKLLLLIVASAAVWVLKVVGICTLCILTFIVWVFYAVVRQGIIVDNLGIGSSFTKSWNMGKGNFFDIFVVLLVFFGIKILLGVIPILGDPAGYLVDAFSVAALTLLYIDRR